MTPAAALRIEPKTTLHVSTWICHTASLLRMSNEELTRYLARAARENPLLDTRPPRAGGHPVVDAGRNLAAPNQSLYAHIFGQIGCALSAPEDLRVAACFVSALEPSGWLGKSAGMIAADASVSVCHAEAILQVMQGFEPAGIFARNLAECLRLQLADRDQFDGVTETVLDNLQALLDGGAASLVAQTGLTRMQVETVLRRLRRCDPKPGAQFDHGAAPIRAPDVIVTRRADTWRIALNHPALPNVTLHQIGPDCPAEWRAMQDAASGLITAVERRNRMMLRVAREVIGHQIGYLERGLTGLRPLCRADVAARLGVHASTVGRVAKGLLVQTPSGMQELARFFSRSLGKDHGVQMSRRRIQNRIRRLIDREDPANPLSDSAIAARLSNTGTGLSRRTVAKYRSTMGIQKMQERTNI